MPAKRCPMCHLASEERAWQCKCGYEFGQPVAQVIRVLRRRRARIRIVFAGLLGVDLLGLGIAVAVGLHGAFLLPALAMGALVRMTIRAGRTLMITSESLAQLEARTQGALSSAIVVKGAGSDR